MTNFTANLEGPVHSFASVALRDVPKLRLDDPNGAENEVFSELLDELAPGDIFLDRAQYGIFAGSIAAQQTIESQFVLRPDFAQGRQASGNEVFFGQLTAKTPSGVGAPEFVAVKPYLMDPTPDSLMREWAANNYVNAIDPYQRAYTQLGVWRANDGALQSISQYEVGVRSFDNVFWAKDESALGLTEEDIQEALTICMYGIGYAHGIGLVHNDRRAKNNASDRRLVRQIDLEDAEMLPTGKDTNTEGLTAEELITDDLAAFTSSLFLDSDTLPHVTDLVATSISNRMVQRSSYRTYVKGYRVGANLVNTKRPAGKALKIDHVIQHFETAAAIA